MQLNIIDAFKIIFSVALKVMEYFN